MGPDELRSADSTLPKVYVGYQPDLMCCDGAEVIAEQPRTSREPVYDTNKSPHPPILFWRYFVNLACSGCGKRWAAHIAHEGDAFLPQKFVAVQGRPPSS
jgi:hypothetical protein